jgi:NADPH2:quinone reductase
VTSRAIVVHETGGPEVLRLTDQEEATPGAGQVRVRTAAAGVNFIDVYFRTGLYPRPLPFVEGVERVAWAGVAGSYADSVMAPVDRLVRVPEGVDDRAAAASMLQGMTAHYLAHGTRQTRPGDVALVHAAAGGTGLLLVQLLARAGASVIGTCSTAEKETLALEAGARHVVRYTEVDFAQEVRRITEGRGADVVYDSVGRDTFEGSLASLRQRGLLVLFGQASGPVPPFDLNRLNPLGSLFVTRPTLAHYTQEREELERRARAVFDAVEKGELRVHIGAEYPLAEAAQAHQALEGRRTTGKVLLIPG